MSELRKQAAEPGGLRPGADSAAVKRALESRYAALRQKSELARKGEEEARAGTLVWSLEGGGSLTLDTRAMTLCKSSSNKSSRRKLLDLFALQLPLTHIPPTTVEVRFASSSAPKSYQFRTAVDRLFFAQQLESVAARVASGEAPEEKSGLLGTPRMSRKEKRVSRRSLKLALKGAKALSSSSSAPGSATSSPRNSVGSMAPSSLSQPLSVFCSTWNQGNMPSPHHPPFIPVGTHDIYVFGGQETTTTDKQKKRDADELKKAQKELMSQQHAAILSQPGDTPLKSPRGASGAGAGGAGTADNADADRKLIKKVAREITSAASKEAKEAKKRAKAMAKEARHDKTKVSEAEAAKLAAEEKRKLARVVKKEAKESAVVAAVAASLSLDDNERKKKGQGWFPKLVAHMGSEYVEVAHHSLWEMKISVFIRKSLAPFVSRVCTNSVATGVGNTLGNKGAVACSFHVEATRLCFVSAHLAAHREKQLQREQNYASIMAQLSLGARGWGVGVQFDHLIWMGDLNTRIELDRERVLEFVEARDWEALAPHDQLNVSRRNNLSFSGFEEGDIEFAPTFKLLKGVQGVYDPQRVPSWTDRVLWRSQSFLADKLKLLAYEAHPEMTTSDHAPVHAEFRLHVEAVLPPVTRTAFLLLTQLCLVYARPIEDHDDLYERNTRILVQGDLIVREKAQSCVVPGSDWGTTSVEPPFHGALGLVVQAHGLELIQRQRLYVIAVDERGEEIGRGVMPLLAVGSGGTPVPFRVKLYLASRVNHKASAELRGQLELKE